MSRRVTAFASALVALTGPTLAQVPAGPQFQVNTYTSAQQNRPALASVIGGSIVVWSSPEGNSGPGVYARRYDASGAALGAELRVNTYTTWRQGYPQVASDTAGRFVVVWRTYLGYGPPTAFARRFDAAGLARGPEFRVHTDANAFPLDLAVASAPGGGFVVAWSGFGAGEIESGVYARRFDGQGAPRGAELHVNTYTTGRQFNPRVATDAGGKFVLAWQGRGSGDLEGIFAQRYDESGAARGSEFRVNTYTFATQGLPAVAADAAGHFVVAWASDYQDGSAYGVFGQRYDSNGAPRGTEFQVSTYTLFNQVFPSVASDADGNFVVAWVNVVGFPNSRGIVAQRYDASGAPRGGEFQVNTDTTFFHAQAQVASDAVGNFVVAWASYSFDGTFWEVFGQRFGGLLPAALDVDSAGNHVLEPGESVDMRPTWRNVNGLAQSFAGTLAGMFGPAGAVYTIADGTASYGTVANGTSAPCGDCYGVSVSVPPQRPATHWDASVGETITPDAQGQHIRWRLHVGDSFTDVPRASPFYRFVETLLHRGVTAGCTTASYCPSSSTTREQMALFVLVAREGADYAPPACVPPNIFADVPETSPFCRWIEELSNRGVVSGCGGGNYCPGRTVNREQVAVLVLRTLDPALDPPACTTPVFNDVPASSPFCRWIEELARRGVISGCGGDNYCPKDRVTREQMGVFLGVTFSLTLYGP